jgi:hypothetical protein
MKWICSAIIINVVASGAAFAQSGANSKAQPTVQTQANSGSDQELNIRAYIELLRSDVKKSKLQIIGQVMQFDADQASVFWPIYKQFEVDLTALGDRTVVLVKKYTSNYDQMTDAVADQLATELLTIEQQRNDLKKRYYRKFKEALDPITATRFLQVENQLERVIDLQIASQLPVIRGSRGEAR